MTQIQRQRLVWTGFPGAPGVTTLYFGDAASAQSAVHDWLVAIQSWLPPDVHITLQPGGDVIEDTNGALSAVWAGTVKPEVQGTAGFPEYSAPSGALTRWETLAIRGGHRLRGRSYLVPLTRIAYAPDGALAAAAVAALAAAANALVGAVTPNMLVWQRPRVARAAYTDGRGIPHKALSGRLGSSAPVVTASVATKAVVLRSRRD